MNKNPKLLERGRLETGQKLDRILWIIYWTCITLSVGGLIAYLVWLVLLVAG